PARRALCRAHPQGREAGRASGPGPGQVRDDDQPESRPGARRRGAADAHRAGRRGNRGRWRGDLACLRLLASCSASPAWAGPPPLGELAADAGADRTEKRIAGAKREGTVTVYSSATTEDMAAIAAAFEKKYGIKVRIWRGSSENIVQRAVAEARGGRFEADVIETGGVAMEAVRRGARFHEGEKPAPGARPSAPRPPPHP